MGQMGTCGELVAARAAHASPIERALDMREGVRQAVSNAAAAAAAANGGRGGSRRRVRRRNT